jgi:hypothetical protein
MSLPHLTQVSDSFSVNRAILVAIGFSLLILAFYSNGYPRSRYSAKQSLHRRRFPIQRSTGLSQWSHVFGFLWSRLTSSAATPASS